MCSVGMCSVGVCSVGVCSVGVCSVGVCSVWLYARVHVRTQAQACCSELQCVVVCCSVL